MDETRPDKTVKKELIARQMKAIPLLLTLQVERACEGGLSKQTVYTWLKQDAFKNEIGVTGMNLCRTPLKPSRPT